MPNTDLSAFLGHWLPQLEDEMRAQLAAPAPDVAAYYQMMHYHMGWVDKNFRASNFPAGKRLRPMLCLLACAEVGGDPAAALPAAAALEILHNFSLVHDDIEDGDETRRHRPTLWRLWGMPQAINAGDGMFALAFAALQKLSRRGVPAETTLQALAIFTDTCMALTEGQFLDMSFEQRLDVTVAEYMRMIQGKTAALVGASLAIGARVGGGSPALAANMQRFGHAIGMAFQIQDDILGIWGDPATTGKPAGNDLLRRKKSLPILHALNHEATGSQFQSLLVGETSDDFLPRALALLEQAGARPFAEEQVRHENDAGLTALQAALGDRATASTLFTLAESLLHRRA